MLRLWVLLLLLLLFCCCGVGVDGGGGDGCGGGGDGGKGGKGVVGGPKGAGKPESQLDLLRGKNKTTLIHGERYQNATRTSGVSQKQEETPQPAQRFKLKAQGAQLKAQGSQRKAHSSGRTAQGSRQPQLLRT